MRGPKSRAGLKAYAEEIEIIFSPSQSLINKTLTSLHSKGRSETKENKEDSKRQQSVRSSHVVFIGGCHNHQGKYRRADEFSEKA
jgi:hypothetical protein